jgi:hypothetical protein
MHDDAPGIEPHVADEDIELLGDIDVYRRLRDYRMAVGEACGGEGLVVVLLGYPEEAVSRYRRSRL